MGSVPDDRRSSPVRHKAGSRSLLSCVPTPVCARYVQAGSATTPYSGCSPARSPAFYHRSSAGTTARQFQALAMPDRYIPARQGGCCNTGSPHFALYGRTPPPAMCALWRTATRRAFRWMRSRYPVLNRRCNPSPIHPAGVFCLFAGRMPAVFLSWLEPLNILPVACCAIFPFVHIPGNRLSHWYG